MVYVSAGEFFMGAEATDHAALPHEKPRHAIRLTRGYYIDSREVSNAQFRAFVRSTNYVTEAQGRGWGAIVDGSGHLRVASGASWLAPLPGKELPPDWERHPVSLVSWNDAMAYSSWVGAGLPTEAQFEFALRSRDRMAVYPWGNEPIPATGAGNFADIAAARIFEDWGGAIGGYDDGATRSAAVGSYQPNRLGLFDLCGNVEEWCRDWFDPEYYAHSQSIDPVGPALAASRTVRGGSWFHGLNSLRSASRRSAGPSETSVLLGFRCARSVY